MSSERAPLPFSDEFWEFVKVERAFAGSLKLTNPDRFEVLRTLIVSQLPEGHPLAENQVLGITYLDKVNLQKGERPFFKQDFVVVSRNRIEPRSSRIAMVVVEQATEPFPPEHPSVLVRRRRRALEQHIVETLVVPLTMVVGEVLADGPP